MLRVHDLEQAIAFYCGALGLIEVRRRHSEGGRYTLVFLSTGADGDDAEIEWTHNWDDTERPSTSRFFGHLAYAVDDIYGICARLEAAGIPINRPPRDGRMAFVRSPDGHSIELLQAGEPLAPQEPWISMPNTGTW
jgi:lactoylglutathione lyase